jgi:hypothetical protein
MQMSDFEKTKVLEERMERKMATVRYVRGIQGTDGGHCAGNY